MPTYEYRCKDCDHTFDAYQSFTDDALTECPSCGGPLKKLFGNVGIAFKGSGFYKTDSRSGASPAKAKAGGNGDSSSSSTSAESGSGSGSKESSSKDSSSGGSSSKGDSSGSSGSSSKPAAATT